MSMDDSFLSDNPILNMAPSYQMPFRGVRSSKFRHVYGSPARKERCYENITITKNAHDSLFCAVNPKFLAVVTEVAGGGCFIVIPIDRIGRLQENNMGRVTGHRGPVLDIKWNPFNDNVIASCSDDCTVKLWYIPDDGLCRNLSDWLIELQGHRRRVSYVEWHPSAENILLSTGFDHLIIVWNVGRGQAVRMLDCHPDIIYSMSFNRDGSLLATTCKDKMLRVIDVRLGKVITEGLAHEGTKAAKVVYLGDSGKLFTTGFSRYSDRQWAVWSQYDLGRPLHTENIDSSSGILFPYYDHDTRMVYVAGKGDGNIRYYEITDEQPWCHYLHQFLSGFPQRGLGFMPKRGLDAVQCEVFRFYKLHATKSIVEPISMIVPRKSEQFQEDLYPDTAAPTPSLTADEWLQGKNKNPILISMKNGVVVGTNKPVIYRPELNELMTSDRNNERKFVFIAEETKPDYRELPRSPSRRVLGSPVRRIESPINRNMSPMCPPASPRIGAYQEALMANQLQRSSSCSVMGSRQSQLSRHEALLNEHNQLISNGNGELNGFGSRFHQIQQRFGSVTTQSTANQEALLNNSPMCDVVTSHRLPSPIQPYVTTLPVGGGDADFFGAEEKHVEIIDNPQSIEDDLRRCCQKLSREVTELKADVRAKDRRIQELEDQVRLLVVTATGDNLI